MSEGRDLNSIYRLEFYKKQKNWKFYTSRQNRDKSQKLKKYRKKTKLNVTYNIDDGDAHNTAFIGSAPVEKTTSNLSSASTKRLSLERQQPICISPNSKTKDDISESKNPSSNVICNRLAALQLAADQYKEDINNNQTELKETDNWGKWSQGYVCNDPLHFEGGDHLCAMDIMAQEAEYGMSDSDSSLVKSRCHQTDLPDNLYKEDINNNQNEYLETDNWGKWSQGYVCNDPLHFEGGDHLCAMDIMAQEAEYGMSDSDSSPVMSRCQQTDLPGDLYKKDINNNQNELKETDNWGRWSQGYVCNDPLHFEGGDHLCAMDIMAQEAEYGISDSESSPVMSQCHQTDVPGDIDNEEGVNCSVGSEGEFMRGAHAAPHSSEIDLSLPTISSDMSIEELSRVHRVLNTQIQRSWSLLEVCVSYITYSQL